jgi:endonuclease/exonuclease/phosphatase family metal-dependent hydrolase
MKKANGKQTVTLTDMNVWFGMDAHGHVRFGEYESSARRRSRFTILVDGLKKLQPDVIAIQEANLLPEYARKLADEMGYDAVWRTTNSGLKILGRGIPTNFRAGSAILAPKRNRLKFLDVERLSGRGLQFHHFSFHFTELRDVIAARITIGRQPFIIFNTQTHFSIVRHQKWNKQLDQMVESCQLGPGQQKKLLADIQKGRDRRKNEILRLVAFVKKITKLNDTPYVIMGDFNTTVDSPAMIHMIKELNLRDAYRIKNPIENGYTWDPGRNTNTGFDASPFWSDGITPKGPLGRLEAEFDARMARRIDFIFLSYQFEPNMIKEADLLFTEPTDGLFASDHFGLRVVLDRLPERVNGRNWNASRKHRRMK